MDDEEGKKKESKKKALAKTKEKPAEVEEEPKKSSKGRKAVKSKTAVVEEPASSQTDSEDSAASQPETSGGAAKNDRLAKRTIDSLYENPSADIRHVHTVVPALTVTLDSTLEISANNSGSDGALISPAPSASTLQVLTNSNNNNNNSLSPDGKANDSGDANDSLSKKIKLSPDSASEAGGRRRHKLVSYKELSLNCKMRRDKENKVVIKAPK